MSLEPGSNLGQYRIVERLGRGGMAMVYKAFQPGLDRYVAIKVLPAFYAEDPTYLERFRQEAKSVARLRHPNILAVFDFGEQEGITYIVSEYVPGGTLAQQMGHPLPLDYVVPLLRPIASALDYAHSQSILHRDVKPSNILLTLDGTPILSDFGLARMTGGARLTESGAAVGTPEYMSPEQAMATDIGPASDIYSLGIVLYEMATGRVPFSAETPMAVVLAHLHNPLPPPRTFAPNLSEAVEAVVLKALAKQPEDRFHTAGEMVAALQRTLPMEGVVAPPIPLMVSRPVADAASAQPAGVASAAAVGQPSPSSTTPAGTAKAAVKPPGFAPRKLPAPILAGIGVLALLIVGGGGALVGGAFSKQPSAPPQASQTAAASATAQAAAKPQAGAPSGQAGGSIPLGMEAPVLQAMPGPVAACVNQALGASAKNDIQNKARAATPQENAAIQNCVAQAGAFGWLDQVLGRAPAVGQPGMQPGGQPGFGQPGMQQQPGGQPGFGQPGMQPQPGGQPGFGQPGMQQPGGQQGFGQPGMQPQPGGQPGFGQPGMQPQPGGQPQPGQPGMQGQSGMPPPPMEDQLLRSGSQTAGMMPGDLRQCIQSAIGAPAMAAIESGATNSNPEQQVAIRGCLAQYGTAWATQAGFGPLVGQPGMQQPGGQFNQPQPGMQPQPGSQFNPSQPGMQPQPGSQPMPGQPIQVQVGWNGAIGEIQRQLQAVRQSQVWSPDLTNALNQLDAYLNGAARSTGAPADVTALASQMQALQDAFGPQLSGTPAWNAAMDVVQRLPR